MDTVKNFFKNRKMELVLFLALLLTAIFSGVNFGLILGLTLFFWATGVVAEIPKGGKTLSVILRVVVIGVFVFSIIAALMTRSYQKRWIALGRFDQFTAWVMGDQNMVKSSDIWEMEKEEKSKKFREYYRNLLAQGKTKEAADTLQKFNQAWDLRKLLKENSPEPEDDPTIQPAPTQPGATKESMTLNKGNQWFPDHFFRKGEKITILIEGLVDNIAADGSRVRMTAGRYERSILNDGAPTFEALSQLAKVTVFYN